MHTNDLAFDTLHIWHPYTSMTKPLPTYPIISATSYNLTLSNGHQLVDGMSSWWSAIHGYNHPVINKAIRNQINYMSHVMFGGIIHPSALELCKRLIAVTPKKLECVFLSDSGSVAIEVAIKIALQYWQARKEPRQQLLSLRKGYHGDTFGALSVCDPYISMHKLYKGYLPLNQFFEAPYRRFNEKWQEGDDSELIKFFDLHHNTLAAIILEPIVQGAGGMHFYHPKYLKIIRELCTRYGVLLIADEIATGFGRTGKWFACDHAGITPDILCVGKALTGGVLTLSATLTCRYIAEIISEGEAGCFMHGPTFMANPLACAAANASLSLLEDENWKLQVKKISEQLNYGLLPLKTHSKVHDVRVIGAIGVVETTHIINMTTLQQWFVDQGVWIRPFGKLIYLIPPYIISTSAISKLITAISDAIDNPLHFIN